MWQILAMFCVLYVETYQQDVVIPPFLLASRSKHALGYPTGNNVIISKPHDRPLNDNFGPKSPPNYAVLPNREGKTTGDLARLRYLLKKHKRTIRELVKSKEFSHEEKSASKTSNRNNFYKRSLTDNPSYYDGLKMVEKFGNYLKKKTQINPLVAIHDDAGRQHIALLAVLIALARIIKDTPCSDVDAVYEKVYLPTVEKHYLYGLNNADKIVSALEEYIRKGNARIPKLLKLKEELCDEHSSCASAFDEKIKNNLVIYAKEVESLETLDQLVRAHCAFSKEFNKATLTGTVLPYLRINKLRMKDYIWKIVKVVKRFYEKTVKSIKCP